MANKLIRTNHSVDPNRIYYINGKEILGKDALDLANLYNVPAVVYIEDNTSNATKPVSKPVSKPAIASDFVVNGQASQPVKIVATTSTGLPQPELVTPTSNPQLIVRLPQSTGSGGGLPLWTWKFLEPVHKFMEPVYKFANDEIFLNKDNIRVLNYQRAMARDPNFSKNWDMWNNINEFYNTVTGGTWNYLTDPTLLVGLARDVKNQGLDALNIMDPNSPYWQGNSGLFTPEYAAEHPILSATLSAIASRNPKSALRNLYRSSTRAAKSEGGGTSFSIPLMVQYADGTVAFTTPETTLTQLTKALDSPLTENAITALALGGFGAYNLVANDDEPNLDSGTEGSAATPTKPGDILIDNYGQKWQLGEDGEWYFVGEEIQSGGDPEDPDDEDPAEKDPNENPEDKKPERLSIRERLRNIFSRKKKAANNNSSNGASNSTNPAAQQGTAASQGTNTPTGSPENNGNWTKWVWNTAKNSPNLSRRTRRILNTARIVNIPFIPIEADGLNHGASLFYEVGKNYYDSVPSFLHQRLTDYFSGKSPYDTHLIDAYKTKEEELNEMFTEDEDLSPRSAVLSEMPTTHEDSLKLGL